MSVHSELGGAWVIQSCRGSEEETEKTSGRVTDNMPGRWSLPLCSVLECRTLLRGNCPAERESTSASCGLSVHQEP